MGRLGHKERGGKERGSTGKLPLLASSRLHTACCICICISREILKHNEEGGGGGEGQENEKAVFSSSGSRKRTSTPALKRGRELLRSLG